MDNSILRFVTQLMETFSKFYNFLTMTLEELVLKAGIEIEIPIIGEWTFGGLMFGGGLFIFIAVCLAQWINPL